MNYNNLINDSSRDQYFHGTFVIRYLFAEGSSPDHGKVDRVLLQINYLIRNASSA